LRIRERSSGGIDYITAHPTTLRVGDVEITRIVETEGAMMTLSSFFIDGESGAKLADNAVRAP
jgi:hypothetical protein